jgi:anaerobic magnesium-protoporphyrin IX monomethyl ester cyclase
LPGTKFFERVKAQLGEKTNWSDSEDLSMMFQGAYTNEFYRALHDALHAQVDSWNSIGSKAIPKGQHKWEEVNELWKRVMHLEKTCRNPKPTILSGCLEDNLVPLQPGGTP